MAGVGMTEYVVRFIAGGVSVAPRRGPGSTDGAAFAAAFYVMVSASIVGAFAIVILVRAMVSAWWLRRKLRITSRRTKHGRQARSASGRGLP